MREIRQSGSEGGEIEANRSSLPLSSWYAVLPVDRRLVHGASMAAYGGTRVLRGNAVFDAPRRGLNLPDA
jgi:hypothetical protein